MKLLAKLIIVIAIFFGGFYFGQQQALSPTNDGQSEIDTVNQGLDQESEEISVSLMLDFGNGQVRTYDTSLAEGVTVFNLLEKITVQENFKFNSKDYGELGVLVESIGDIENDARGEQFWQYWVNNEYAKIGASNYDLNDGDVVEWKFIKGQFNN